MGHISTPIQLVKKLAGTLAECGAAKYQLYKNCAPQEYRRFAGGAGTRMSALVCRTFRRSSPFRQRLAGEGRFNDEVRFYLGQFNINVQLFISAKL